MLAFITLHTAHDPSKKVHIAVQYILSIMAEDEGTRLVTVNGHVFSISERPIFVLNLIMEAASS